MKWLKGKRGHSGDTHVVIAFVVLAILYYFNLDRQFIDTQSLQLLDYAAIVFIIWAYSRAPDLDHPGSTISKYFMIFGASIIIFAFITDQKVLGITVAIMILIFRLITHRTIAHSVGAGAILAAPLYFVNPLYALAGFLAFVSHIISEGEFSIWSESDIKLLK